MKIRWYLLACILASLIVLPRQSELRAQLVTGRFVSSVYTWELMDTIGVSKRLSRGFQSMMLDVGQGDFSIHTHVQGAMNLQKELEESPDLRLWYLYARMRKVFSVADLSIGRVPYFAGVGSGTMDGGLVTFFTADQRSRATLYGGANLPTDLGFTSPKPLEENFVSGAQIVSSAIENLRLGMSYMNRQRSRVDYWSERPDSLFNPQPTFIMPDVLKEQYISADFSYQLEAVRVYGRYDHDLNEDNIQRAQAGFRCDAGTEWVLTADYVYREPRIAFNSYFNLFNAGKTEELEAGADFKIAHDIRLFGRVGYVQYEGDEGTRWTAGAAHTYGGITYRGNGGYSGELTSISAEAMYPLFNNMLVPSAALTYSLYKLRRDTPQQQVMEVVFGSTIRPLSQFSVDLQGQWMDNPVYKSDFRFSAKLNFWFSEQLHLFN